MQVDITRDSLHFQLSRNARLKLSPAETGNCDGWHSWILTFGNNRPLVITCDKSWYKQATGEKTYSLQNQKKDIKIT
jgi:hypothetical protein